MVWKRLAFTLLYPLGLHAQAKYVSESNSIYLLEVIWQNVPPKSYRKGQLPAFNGPYEYEPSLLSLIQVFQLEKAY